METCALLPSRAGCAVAIAVSAAVLAAAAAIGRVPAAVAGSVFCAIAVVTASFSISGPLTALRAVATGVAIACALWSRRPPLAALSAALIVSLAVGASGLSCTAVFAADGGVAAVAVAVAAIYVRSLVLYAAELLVIILFLGADSGAAPRSRHLTWWGVAAVAALDAAALLPPRRRPAVASAQAVVSLTVVAGTVMMSAMECDVLTDAFEALGTVGYVSGNFIIHYYPAVRGFSSVSTNAFPMPVVVSGAVAGVSIVSAYTAVVMPASTYGCALSDATSIGALAAGSLLSAAAVFIVASDYSSRVMTTHGAIATAM